MARINAPFLAFNRGLLSPRALARVDLDRTRLSAERFENWLPATQGSMSIRPGTKHFGSSINDTGAAWIEFIPSTDDVALIEVTDLKLRFWQDTGGTTSSGEVEVSETSTPSSAHALSLLERPHVTGTLSISDTGWESASVGGGTSQSGGTLNAGAIGSIARKKKRFIVSSTNVEHSLAINISRGPVTIRVGSTDSGDEYVNETALGTGRHNLAFTPTGNFHIMLSNDKTIDRVVSSIAIGDSGTVELVAPWDASVLDDLRYDQSADVAYVVCDSVRQRKIERRGTGRSWSVVEYAPDNGPFLPTRSTAAKLQPSYFYGNITLNSDLPLFKSTHVGSLVRIFHEGQSGVWKLGNLDAKSDAIEVTGISDTGAETGTSERAISFVVSGTFVGGVMIERSVNGPDLGFKELPTNLATPADTGGFTATFTDQDDNLKVWYRARMTPYTSGTATVTATYAGGGTTGIGRITAFTSTKAVSLEVLKRFSDTGASDNWQFGYWSDARGFPSSVGFHGGRLAFAGGASVFLSVSDDFENFDDTTEGDAGPIIRTLGSGPVDAVQYIVSLLRLIIGTEGAEIAMRSSSLDEPLTPNNSSAGVFSTQGSAPLRALKMDNRAIAVQRSRKRVYMVGAGSQTAFGDYESFDLTMIVPDLLKVGVTSVAIQRQPDTRIHCALSDGTVAILTYEPGEEVVCWHTWSTDGFVEKVMVLPAVSEDAVYYHIKRDIGNGNDSKTEIMLNMEGVDGLQSFTDINNAGNFRAWTASGNANTDNAQKKFGNTSLACDGTGDYISRTAEDAFHLGDQDFTIDFWFMCTAASGTLERLAGQSTGTASSSAWDTFRTTGDIIQVRVSDGSSFTTINGTTQYTSVTNTGFHHFALIRTGNTLKLFLDGVQEGGDATFTGTVPNVAAAFNIGTVANDGTDSWTGWIDAFRMSRGIARWTSGFTPPTAAYTNTVKRFLEKWALETECIGDTGLTWIMDCAKSYSDTGRTSSLTGFTHLEGREVVVWSDDTGSTPGVDRSPDVDGEQTTYTVSTAGVVTLSAPVHHAVVGLPYKATWKSAKLAYGAQAGTALAQMKRVAQMALSLYRTHRQGFFFGSDTGNLSPLPAVLNGSRVATKHIFQTLDSVAVPFPGSHDPDARLVMRGKAPRPVTVLAGIPSVQSNERT